MNKIIVAKALVFDNQEKLLLIRRSKTAPRRPLEWDFPGGFVDQEDDSYQHACMREIFEETGITIAHNHLTIVYAESAINALVDKPADVTWLYFSGTTSITDVSLSYEHDNFVWVTLDKAKELIKYDKQIRALEYFAATKV